MATKHQRITNGHRAAVCALVLAGVPFIQSCKIAGINHLRIRSVLPADWSKRAGQRRHRWYGLALEELHDAWCDSTIRTATLINQFRIQRGTLYKLVVKHDWPRRPKGPAPLPTGIRQMTVSQRTAYRKVQRDCGRAAAVQAVFGT